jgi:hypothetical protein
MAIFCAKCGKEHPDDANFCMKCGKPLGEAVQTAAQPEPQWEYCEIVYQDRHEQRLFGEDYFFQFWAKGVGSNGTFNAGEVEETKSYYGPGQSVQRDRDLVDRLIKLLTSKGWEVLPNRGDAWFSYKFRRRIR